jgi:hypothetical protein
MACCGIVWVRESQLPSPPPVTFQDSELGGTWEAHYYGGRIDRLVIKGDGTFKQVYYEKNYVYETPWNEWWVERFLDGRVWVHLKGARYFVDGIEYPQMPAHCDPFSEAVVEMVGEVILNVRQLSSEELILYQMWHCGDSGGLPLIGRDPNIFRRIRTP